MNNNFVTIRTALKMKRLDLSIGKETDFYIVPYQDFLNRISCANICYKGIVIEVLEGVSDLYEKLNLPTFEDIFNFFFECGAYFL